jgi:hypothetical protein
MIGAHFANCVTGKCEGGAEKPAPFDFDLQDSHAPE